MPNNIYQKLSISDWSDRPEGEFKKAVGKLLNEDGLLDFRKIIPQPENLFQESISDEKKRELDAQGIPNWYDWNIDNWGTKWNAYDVNVQRMDDNRFDVTFQTAWGIPEPIMEKIFDKFKDCDIEYLAACEMGNFTYFITREDRKTTQHELNDHNRAIMFALR